ncbi:MAG: NYN domain-containing protein [Candidatus Bipolaricaulota bacterium]
MSENPAAQTQRLRVFLDYWNFQLTLNERAGAQLKLDWIALPVWIANRADEVIAATGESPGKYVGGIVYASYDAWNPKDGHLKSWLENVVSRAPGMKVVTKERKPKSPPKCPVCHAEISVCPYCKEPIRRMGEKGIDTGLVTDLLKHAWEDTYDTAVLVSADADYIPAVEFVQEKGKRVIHVGFPPDGMELRKACWSSVDLGSLIGKMPLRS